MVNSNRATALSLFAGIGGFEVGMSKCGFSFLKTLEWDENCCETLNHNRRLTGSTEDNIKPIDITKMLPQDFWNSDVDYIVGGPPCQSFSAAGRRAGGVAGTSDIRGTLFGDYCQYVNHFKPKAFVFENVRGILSSKKGEDFKIICAAFEEVDYRLFWRILNAADFGVSQLRERVFLVGIRNDINIEFRFPRPTHGPDSIEKRPYITPFETLEDIYDENEVVPPYGGKYGHLLPDIPCGENYRFYTEEMGHPEPLFAWRSKFSNFLYKMDPNEVCRTIIAYQGRYDGPFHWKNRKCTVDELKRLQGFPTDFIIPFSNGEGIKQVGNSVCPPIAYRIGQALRYQLEGLVEYEVPLIDPEQKLSFDKRKGAVARKSRAKKANKYSDIKQMNLFDMEETDSCEYPEFNKTGAVTGIDVKWIFKNGELEITLGSISNGMPTTKIDLTFFGNVTSSIKKITAKAFCSFSDGIEVQYLWTEIHRGICEITSYDSLMPLYGHFTEPYPKFEINFDTHSSSPAMQYQRLALKDSLLNKVQPYSVIGNDTDTVENLLKAMRDFGFDVRTSYTNKTIPEYYFRICYPFTMPADLKTNIAWAEAK
ncbi:MAG: DNA cytosine methyltransferase [Oscillospiraceae bacterium]|jgi:DNA (cytosine-5)-methyltransferase 1|nr:DNA cytosine methyltransferase [Oscillospiraceae bacterium]